MNRQPSVAEGGHDAARLLDSFERDRLAVFTGHGFYGESRWVTDRQGRRTYLVGRGHGHPPTVLIHGGLSQAGEWSLLAGRLPGHVLIPDRPGCGLSYRIDYRTVADYRKAATDWLLDLANGIGADQLDLVGSSMGGFFSIAFATAHPDRVRRLVLVGYPAGLGREVPLFVRLWGNPITGPVIGKHMPTDPEILNRHGFRAVFIPAAAPVGVQHSGRLRARLGCTC